MGNSRDYVFLYAQMCACISTCLYVCLHLCFHVGACMCVRVCVCICVCAWMCACWCLCVCICIFSRFSAKNSEISKLLKFHRRAESIGKLPWKQIQLICFLSTETLGVLGFTYVSSRGVWRMYWRENARVGKQSLQHKHSKLASFVQTRGNLDPYCGF